MAELVDAGDLKSLDRKIVRVRVPSLVFNKGKMSKEFEVKEHIRKEIVVKKTTCDLCEEVAPESDGWNKNFEINEVKISFITGSIYPEGSFTTKFEYDVCPDCWDEKIKPLFKTKARVTGS